MSYSKHMQWLPTGYIQSEMVIQQHLHTIQEVEDHICPSKTQIEAHNMLSPYYCKL